MRRIVIAFCLALSVLCVPSPAARAAVQRTFVASTGNDASPCSLAMPCRSFGVALGQTNAGGEIVALDSAGYGAVTIAQSVSIIAPPGVYAGVSVFSGAGISVAAGASDEVVIRGITINAQGGTAGIAFTSGSVLRIEDCTIRGFAGPGAANIRFAATGLQPSALFVRNSFVRDGTIGIDLAAMSPSSSALVDHTRLQNNATGISMILDGRMTLTNSVVTKGTGHAVDIHESGTQPSEAVIDSTLIAQNGGNGLNVVGNAGGSMNVLMSNSQSVRNAVGVNADGGTGAVIVRLTNSVVGSNAIGVQAANGASIVTPLSNTIESNGTDGTVSGNYTPK